MMMRNNLSQDILNLGCALNGVRKRCRFEHCFHPEVLGTGACSEHLEEITPLEYEQVDSEDELGRTDKIDEVH